MIVKRGWARKRKAKNFERGSFVIERWCGWFLFGFFPLYIKHTHSISISEISYGV